MAERRGVSVMTQEEYLALPESIRGRAGAPVGVVELTGTTHPDAPRLVRLECRPGHLRRCHMWLDAVKDRNEWGGRVRSWEERR